MARLTSAIAASIAGTIPSSASSPRQELPTPHVCISIRGRSSTMAAISDDGGDILAGAMGALKRAAELHLEAR